VGGGRRARDGKGERERTIREDVQAGGVELAGLKGGEEGFLVDYASSGTRSTRWATGWA
jgi:hypothetical protein